MSTPTTSDAFPPSYNDSALDLRDLKLLPNWRHFTSLISTIGVQILQIWELPRPGSKYYIGVDVSDGIGADRSVISVVRAATDLRPFE